VRLHSNAGTLLTFATCNKCVGRTVIKPVNDVTCIRCAYGTVGLFDVNTHYSIAKVFYEPSLINCAQCLFSSPSYSQLQKQSLIRTGTERRRRGACCRTVALRCRSPSNAAASSRTAGTSIRKVRRVERFHHAPILQVYTRRRCRTVDESSRDTGRTPSRLSLRHRRAANLASACCRWNLHLLRCR